MKLLPVRCVAVLFCLILTVSWSVQSSAQIVYAVTGSLHTGRADHSSTLLQDGTVLVAGGLNGTAVTATAELYNSPAGNFSTTTGNMTVPRYNHTATLLNNGKVLIVGGGSSGSTAELYNPATGTFTATGNLNVPRSGGHTATLLSNGKVLIAGGADVNGNYGETDAPSCTTQTLVSLV